MSENKEKKGGGIGLVIGIALIYILVGLAVLLVPDFKTVYIVYAAGIILLVYGIILIVKYFMSGSYRILGKYGFSGGVLCVIIGICMLIRSQTVAGDVPLFLGICILFTAVIKLQNAVALKTLEDGAWAVFLIIALVFVAASLIVILDILHLNVSHTVYIYYVLVADGAVSLAETLYLALAIRRSDRKLSRANEIPMPVETPAEAEPVVCEAEVIPEPFPAPEQTPENVLIPDRNREKEE